VEKIASAHPIYGMQARGIDGVDEPLTSVEAMAQFHLEAIKQLQPHGLTHPAGILNPGVLLD